MFVYSYIICKQDEDSSFLFLYKENKHISKYISFFKALNNIAFKSNFLLLLLLFLKLYIMVSIATFVPKC